MVASTLIVYYSMTGRTRSIANELRRAMNADIEEIREPSRRTGLPGIWRALFDASLRRRSEILPPSHDVASYDLIVLGGPIWAGKLATPVRSLHGSKDLAPPRLRSSAPLAAQRQTPPLLTYSSCVVKHRARHAS